MHVLVLSLHKTKYYSFSTLFSDNINQLAHEALYFLIFVNMVLHHLFLSIQPLLYLIVFPTKNFIGVYINMLSVIYYLTNELTKHILNIMFLDD